MSRATQRKREQFIADLLKLVPTATLAHARKLLRWGATYARLSEAECNGDWPVENGEGKRYECPKCQGGWRVRSALRECPSCRAERIIRETCESMTPCGECNCGGMRPCVPDNIYGCVPPGLSRSIAQVTPHFQGDPRGHTVRLQIAGQPLDAFGRPALAVPTS